MNRSKNLTEGNIKKQLAQLTWPMMLGMMGMVVFNLVDTFFVGKLGVQKLSAMSFSFPVVMLIGGLTQGVGIGTSSLVSRNIISSDRQEVKKMASRAILLGVLIVMIFAIAGYFTIQPVFSALGARGEALDQVSKYMHIWYLGVPFVVIPMIGNNIVRATGDTFTPGMIMVVSGILNALLDPFLIFGIGPFPEMGIEGAALATVISRSVGLLAILYILINKLNLFTYKFGNYKAILTTWKDILHIAGPASLTMLITPISLGIITKLIAGFGKEAIAAFGVASRIEMFALMPIMALGSVLIIFMGQNFSKSEFGRISKGLSYSFKFSMIWGAVVFVLLLLFGKVIASIFTVDLQVIKFVYQYFIIIGASYGLGGIVGLSSSGFNALNKPFPSTIISITRMIVLYVPLAWIGSQLLGINGIFLAGFIASLIGGILSYKYLLSIVANLSKRISAEN